MVERALEPLLDPASQNCLASSRLASDGQSLVVAPEEIDQGRLEPFARVLCALDAFGDLVIELALERAVVLEMSTNGPQAETRLSVSQLERPDSRGNIVPSVPDLGHDIAKGGLKVDGDGFPQQEFADLSAVEGGHLSDKVDNVAVEVGNGHLDLPRRAKNVVNLADVDNHERELVKSFKGGREGLGLMRADLRTRSAMVVHSMFHQ